MRRRRCEWAFLRVIEYGGGIGFGIPPSASFWLGPLTTGEGFRESHFAFIAPDRAAVGAGDHQRAVHGDLSVARRHIHNRRERETGSRKVVAPPKLLAHTAGDSRGKRSRIADGPAYK